MLCPECKQELRGAAHSYSCPGCKIDWHVDFHCEICASEVKKLSSCGSVSFFCEQCKRLKSRESMDKRFHRESGS